MVWDITTPLGTESKSLGDDRLREIKSDLQVALRGQEATGVEAIFPGSDATNPVYRYRGLKGTSGARPAAGQYGLYINETTNTIQRDNGVSWVDVATHIPSGTVMVFYQAAAPVGWTKLVTQNDKALRVVSAAGGGAGGTLPVSTGVSHSHTVNSHTHDLSNHTHTGPSHTHTVPVSGYGAAGGTPISGTLRTLNGAQAEINANVTPNTGSGGTGATSTPSNNTSGAATPGTDTQAPIIAYIDVLICSKD